MRKRRPHQQSLCKTFSGDVQRDCKVGALAEPFSSRCSRAFGAIQKGIGPRAARPSSIGLSRRDRTANELAHSAPPTAARDGAETMQRLRPSPYPRGSPSFDARPASRRQRRKPRRGCFPLLDSLAAPRILGRERLDGSGHRPGLSIVVQCSWGLHVVDFGCVSAAIVGAALVGVADHDGLVSGARGTDWLFGCFSAAHDAVGCFVHSKHLDIIGNVGAGGLLLGGWIAGEDGGGQRVDGVHFSEWFLDSGLPPEGVRGAFLLTRRF